VTPRDDGVLARCGGPSICHVCAVEAAQVAIAKAQELLRQRGDEYRRAEASDKLAEAAKALAEPPGEPAKGFAATPRYPYVTRNPGPHGQPKETPT
jgi:hypothetical protein